MQKRKNKQLLYNAPVLLLVFNRPEKFICLIDALRLVKPKVIYIAGDGPRRGSPQDLILVQKTRQLISEIDWSCEIRTLFNSKNLGCRKSVSAAIDWFFENVNEGIILEDDCIPDASFFKFANQMLVKYRSDNRIMSIGAQHFANNNHIIKDSYFFSRHVHCWGWATWKRAWSLYDKDMKNWPKLSGTRWLYSLGGNNIYFERYWKEIFNNCFQGKIDSWAYRWLFSCWSQNGLSILPAVNLVTNIGFGIDSTHTAKGNDTTENLPIESMNFPLKHPATCLPDFYSDKWTDKYVFEISAWSAFKSMLAKVSWLRQIIIKIKGIIIKK